MGYIFDKKVMVKLFTIIDTLMRFRIACRML